jgi:hypothetical protein
MPPSVLISFSLKSVVAHGGQSRCKDPDKQCTTDDFCSYDYTKGKLNELVDIIIDSGAKLFGEYPDR